MVTVRFFGPIIGFTSGEKKTEIPARTVAEAIRELCAKYGRSFSDRVLNPDGSLRASVHVLINGRDIRFMKQLYTEIRQEDELSFMPAVGGG
jgi:MoaD family protein